MLRSSRSESEVAKGKFIKEFWDFAKGRLEPGEKGIEAARREAEEEAGIKNPQFMPDFKETLKYFTRREGKPIPKFVAMFLAEAGINKVKLSWEHDKYEWLSFKKARERLSLLPMKKALEAAEKYLNKMFNS